MAKKKRCGTTVMVNNDGYQRDMKRKQQKNHPYNYQKQTKKIDISTSRKMMNEKKREKRGTK